jgi:hypothetical protein
MYPSKRSMAAAMTVLSALAIAAPITGASAATTPSPLPGWDLAAMPTSSLPVFPGAPSSLEGGALYAYGGESVNNVLNGATVVQVINGPAFSLIGP